MFILGVPRPGVGGDTLMALGWCLLGVGAAGILSLVLLQTMEGAVVLPPARLLGFCCCTALLWGGVWRERPVYEYFFFPRFSFCQTYLLPLVKVLGGAQGRKSKKRVN